mmetsp:Transcript_14458/g.17579  ORF Transcript_14458/g.17579 Transcript_14458/m.17579 type:complete len:226 (+) Transcript_14458:74-751(+)
MPFNRLLVISCILLNVNAWVAPSITSPISKSSSSSTQLGLKIGKNYEPKWKKIQTLADKEGIKAPQDVGLQGTVNVVFKQGKVTTKTIANPGDPIRDVASQAGQFIKYGCGVGDCGTCQALCNGKYVKPCVDVVPGDVAPGEEYVIQVKEIKSKKSSSGKFYSARSFVMGFYNNILGMIGLVRDRRLARKNYQERINFEAEVARKAAEKKAAREAAAKLEAEQQK